MLRAMSQDASEIGAELVAAGVADADDIDAAVAAARANQTRLLSQCLTSGLADERELCRVLARHRAHPVLVVSRSVLDLGALGLVPRVVAEQHRLLPVAVDDDTLTIAVADAEEREVFQHVAFASGRRVVPLLALDGVLKERIVAAYDALAGGKKLLAGGAVEDEVAGLPLLVVERPERPNDDALELIELIDEAPDEDAPPTDALPTVLVVDDEPDIRSLLSRALEKDGYRVETAADGRAAMASLNRQVPGIVLLDAMLPEIHGFEICRAIKQSARWQHVPVIIISAVYKGWEQAREIQEFHLADAFIEKPFELPYVRELVARFMGQESRREELDADRKKQVLKIKNVARVSFEMGELGDAAEAIESWLELDPFDARAYVFLGNVHMGRDAHEEAMKAYERAVTFGPDSYPAFKNLALVYERLGFLRRAHRAWSRAQTLADATSRAYIDQRLRERYAAFG